jgi:hypothetical protein
MKLTNKQMSLVVDMIYDKVKPALAKLADQEKEDLYYKAMNFISGSNFYKAVVAVFKLMPQLHSVEFTDKELHKHFPWITGTWHTRCDNP